MVLFFISLKTNCVEHLFMKDNELGGKGMVTEQCP